MVDFMEDLRVQTMEMLEKYQVEYKKSEETHALIVRLYTFFEKYIPPLNRDVFISKELTESLDTYPNSVRVAFEKMSKWARGGKDINCFQSRGLRGSGSRDYQNMIYRVVHLHLSAKADDVNPVVKEDGFTKPGKYLLYAYSDAASAYFIKILKHPKKSKGSENTDSEWISKDILGIITRNWPELLADRKIENAFLCDEDGNRIDIDDNAIAALTASHVNTMFCVGNALYSPGLGMTASGDSFIAVLNANRLYNDAVIAQKYYEDNEKAIFEVFERLSSRYNQRIPTSFDIHYDYVDSLKRFLVVDRNSGVAYDCKTNMFVLCTA